MECSRGPREEKIVLTFSGGAEDYMKKKNVKSLSLLAALAALFAVMILGCTKKTAGETAESVGQNGTDYLVIVSKASPMQKGFTDGLEFVTVDTVYDDEKTDVEKNAYAAYLSLQSALEKQGIEIGIDSSYRSVAEQERIMKDFTEKYGEDYAKKTVAIPGTSEHHTGLAIDIVPKVDGEWKWENEDMMNLPELFAKIHAELPGHGFILRYLKGKEDITGYAYEPWHIRYIASKEIAQKIYDEGITLEEYKARAE